MKNKLHILILIIIFIVSLTLCEQTNMSKRSNGIVEPDTTTYNYEKNLKKLRDYGIIAGKRKFEDYKVNITAVGDVMLEGYI